MIVVESLSGMFIKFLLKSFNKLERRRHISDGNKLCFINYGMEILKAGLMSKYILLYESSTYVPFVIIRCTKQNIYNS